MSELDYTRLLLGEDIPFNDNLNIHVPTIKDIADISEGKFARLFRPFVISTREIFAESPEVDDLEKQFPTLWVCMKDPQVDASLGPVFDTKTVSEAMIASIAYWTQTNIEDYQLLSNGKIISETHDTVFDAAKLSDFGRIIKMLVDYHANKDLIPPRDMSPKQRKMWNSLYKGRKRRAEHSIGMTLADKILILSVTSGKSLAEVSALNYYQFLNLYDAYEIREATEKQFAIYTSYKFDTKDMKMKDWRAITSIKRL